MAGHPGSGPEYGDRRDLDDLLNGFLGSDSRTRGDKEEKGLPWEAKIIDGKYYVPLRQVAELLEQNGVLAKVRRGIEKRVAERAVEEAKASQRRAGKFEAAEGLRNANQEDA